MASLPQMRLGLISYCYHHEPVAAVLGRVRALGLEHLELWYGHPDGRADYQKRGEAEARALRAEAEEAGIAIPTFCIGGWSGVDAGRVQRAIAFARGLGAATVTGCATPAVAEALAPAFASAGLRFGIENHRGNVFERPADLLPVLARTGEAVGCNFDSGHFLLAGCDVLEAAEALRGRIYHVHLKDIDLKDGPAGQPAPVGEGALPLDALVAALRAQGYAGLLSIEHEIAGDPTAELQVCVRHAREALQTAGV